MRNPCETLPKTCPYCEAFSVARPALSRQTLPSTPDAILPARARGAEAPDVELQAVSAGVTPNE